MVHKKVISPPLLLQVNTPFPPMTQIDLISLKSACNFHYFTITNDTVHTPLNLRTFFLLENKIKHAQNNTNLQYPTSKYS